MEHLTTDSSLELLYAYGLVTFPFKSSFALIGSYQNKRFLLAMNCDVTGLTILIRGDDRIVKG